MTDTLDAVQSWMTQLQSNMAGYGPNNQDVVWRLTFFFVFGRKYASTYNQF